MWSMETELVLTLRGCFRYEQRHQNYGIRKVEINDMTTLAWWLLDQERLKWRLRDLGVGNCVGTILRMGCVGVANVLFEN